MDKILFKSSQTLLSKKEVKKILDENFNLASNIISLIYSEENIRLNYFCITEKSKKLLLNLEKIEPYLILKGIFEEKEYRDNFDKFLLLVNDFSSFKNKFFFKKNYKIIQELIEYFVNSKGKNKINTEDIGFKVNNILSIGVTKIPFEKIMWYIGGIDQEYRDNFEIVRYNENLEKRALFIPGINTVRQDRSEITSNGFTQFDKNYHNFDGKNKLEAYGNGNNFDGLFEAIGNDYGIGIDFVNSYYIFERNRVENVIKKIQEYLQTEQGQKIETIISHSYGAMISQALDLSGTNIKKVVQICSPFGENFPKSISIPRESYIKKISKRNVVFLSFGFAGDNIVNPRFTKYKDEINKIVNKAEDHCKGFYYKYINPEIYREILDFSGFKRKK